MFCIIMHDVDKTRKRNEERERNGVDMELKRLRVKNERMINEKFKRELAMLGNDDNEVAEASDD
jgi:hypothetical protein